jgi:hypothetical protein
LFGIRAQPETVLTKLQLKQKGEFSEVPEAPLCGVMLDTRWYVVVANGDFRFVEPARLEDLSFDCEVVGGLVDEHSMVSQAVAWRDGQLQWDVTHEGRVNRTHLQVEGAPPHEMFSLAEEARGNKKPFVDHMFEVPPGLLHAWMGFRLEGPHRFETLVAAEQPWRAFHHPDGRLWAIRPGGAGYQLRIGAPDDPVLKERPSGRALRDVEALIAEQVADGFLAD